MSSTLEAARSYLARGYSVIPVQARGKKPLVRWEEFQTRRASETEVDEWWERWPNANVAVVTGKISGVVVADVDGDRGGDPKILFDRAATGTLVQTGSGGFHFFYRYPEDQKEVPNSVGRGGIDVRGDGGYVVAASSVHPSGGLYKTLREGDLAEFSSSVRRTIDDLNGVQPATGLQLRQEEWLGQLMKGVESGGRNDACARLSGYFASKGLPQDVVLSLLQDWNSKNEPPLPRDEVSVTVASIFKSEIHKRKSAEQSKVQINTVPFGTYMTRYGGEKIRWAVEEWLPSATVAFVISPPGGFKTWLMLDLAESIASGRKFLGQFAVVEPGPALIIQQEDFHGQIVSRLSTIVAVKTGTEFVGGKGEDFEAKVPVDIPIHFHPDRALRFENAGAMASLEERVAEIRPKIVIIDPLYAAARVDDYMAKTAEQMLPLKKMRDRYGCSFLIVHHTKKNTEGAARREGAGGSQFLNAVMETGWQIRATDDEASIVVSRHFKVSKNPAPVSVSFGISTEIPYRYEVSCSEVTADKKNRDLVEVVEKHGPIDVDGVAERLKKHRTTIARKLKKLFDDGAISKDKQDRYFVPSMPSF